MYQEINSQQLKELLKNERINLIDIRDSYLYSLGTINNAINIPINFLLINPSNYLKKEEKYYIFCSYGNTSKEICEYLKRIGYNVVNIKDGYEGYLDSIN